MRRWSTLWLSERTSYLVEIAAAEALIRATGCCDTREEAERVEQDII